MACVPPPPQHAAARSSSTSSSSVSGSGSSSGSGSAPAPAHTPASLPPIYVRQVMLLCLYLRALLDSQMLASADVLVEAVAFALAHSAVGQAAALFKALVARHKGGAGGGRSGSE